MYSSHTIDSVTYLRLSARWISAQSGSSWRRCPSLVPALAHSRASSAVSVIPAGSGQVRPAATTRLIVSRTVDGAASTRRAISRTLTPASFSLITSRTRRIASLSLGIQVPPSLIEDRTLTEPEEVSSPGRHQIGTVGGIKSERWAASSRNGGRYRSESARLALPELPDLSLPIEVLGQPYG